MTDREKAIVMAHTGICTLAGDKFQIFHKYVEDIIGRPVYTHELLFLGDEIKEKSKIDFITLCEEEDEETKWIKTSDQLPNVDQHVLVTTRFKDIEVGELISNGDWMISGGFYFETDEILAWQPLPEPYKEESEE